MSEDRKQPSWVYSDIKPSEDKVYFENLTRCIFQAGLSWQIISKKWPNFQRAFDGFDIHKIAVYDDEDIKRLSEDAGIIRNRQKILATIHNAKEFESIIEEYGRFQNWIDSFDKSHNYDVVVRKLGSRFKRVGKSTAHIFLWSVGEGIKYDPTVHKRRPSKIV